jgi:hypothetical protein
VAIAAEAAQSDVGSEPVDQPIVAAAWMSTAERHDVAKPELDHLGLTWRHYAGL